MSIKDRIYNFIDTTVGLESLNTFADSYPRFKHETLNRSLRTLVTEEKIHKLDIDKNIIPIQDRSTTIYYYKPYVRVPILKLKTPPHSDLNVQLEHLKGKIKVDWNNQEIFRDINKALNSKYNTTKTSILDKYSDYLDSPQKD